MAAAAAGGDDLNALLAGAEEEVPGPSVDRFKLLEKIGEGTYGVVYRARDSNMSPVVQPRSGTPVHDEAMVALKKMRLDAHDEGVPVTTLREVALLKDLRHDNIVRLREVIPQPPKLFLVQNIEKTGVVIFVHGPRNILTTKHAVPAQGVEEISHEPPANLQTLQHLAMPKVPAEHQTELTFQETRMPGHPNPRLQILDRLRAFPEAAVVVHDHCPVRQHLPHGT